MKSPRSLLILGFIVYVRTREINKHSKYCSQKIEMLFTHLANENHVIESNYGATKTCQNVNNGI